PTVAVVRDAGTRIDSASDGQVTGKAVMTDFSGACEYSSKGVAVTANLTINGEAGPAATGQPLTYDYFIAVTDPDRTILAKQVMQVTLPVAGGKAQAVDRVSQFISLPPQV